MRYEMTFETLAEHEGNALARRCALEVAEQRGERYDPMLVLGPRATGKTHLLNAIAARVRELRPEARVELLTAADFANDFIAAVSDRSVDEFRSRFAKADVLLLDGANSLARKVGTQEQLENLLAGRIESGRVTVVALPVPLSAVEQLRDRLASLMSSGMIVELAEPDSEARQRILASRAEAQGVTLSDDVIEYIANAPLGDTRVRLGAMIRVMAVSELQGETPDLALAQRALRGLMLETDDFQEMREYDECDCECESCGGLGVRQWGDESARVSVEGPGGRWRVTIQSGGGV